jgi:hypothetical protein
MSLNINFESYVGKYFQFIYDFGVYKILSYDENDVSFVAEHRYLKNGNIFKKITNVTPLAFSTNAIEVSESKFNEFNNCTEPVEPPVYMYNCGIKRLYPPHNFIHYNLGSGYKNEIDIDECLEEEILDLWSKGIKTMGCCCGHGLRLGFIQVEDDCIEEMLKLGYQNYIYDDEFGGKERKDAFIPKTTKHIYQGYRNGFWC